MLVYLILRLMPGLVEENKIRTCTTLTHHLKRMNKSFSGTEPRGLVVSDRENIQGRHHLTSPLRANISETSLVPLINEQGEKEKGRKDEREFSWCCSFSWGFGCRGTERRRTE